MANAAKDIAMIAERLEHLARSLIDQGFDRSENTFDANDMRDIAYAEIDEQFLKLYCETQNGLFRIDICLDDSSEPSNLQAFTIASWCAEPIGRFRSVDGEWCSDYAGIEHSIESVRHMDALISSLESLSCVVEDEYQADSPEP